MTRPGLFSRLLCRVGLHRIRKAGPFLDVCTRCGGEWVYKVTPDAGRYPGPDQLIRERRK